MHRKRNNFKLIENRMSMGDILKKTVYKIITHHSWTVAKLYNTHFLIEFISSTLLVFTKNCSLSGTTE